MSGQHENEKVKMEINGQPYYVKSKGNVPYLYDIDTHDEVGYWSSKKGGYVMFSLYNRLMKEKYDNQGERMAKCSSESETMGSGFDSESQESEEEETESEEEETESEEEETESEEEETESEEEETESEEEETESEEEETESEEEETESEEESLVETKNQTNTHSLMFLFIILFVYLILQREIQSIHFDFIFMILINLLNTLKTFEM
jgi:cation transport ATPase